MTVIEQGGAEKIDHFDEDGLPYKLNIDLFVVGWRESVKNVVKKSHSLEPSTPNAF